MRYTTRSVAFVLGCLAMLASARSDDPTHQRAERLFEEKVRPILANRCLKCHGSEKQESGLRVDSQAALLTGGEREMPAVVPGKPRESALVLAIRYDGELRMPPDNQLGPDEISAIEAWVALGAVWPKQSAALIQLTNEDRKLHARATHWAFQPIQRPEIPTSHADGVLNPIDAFVLEKLENAGMAPSPAADRPTLVRRATFDLWGLPPTPEQVAAFVSDPSPDAYARLIDRLLASPRYGERWGRHWLDVARYADTRGYAFARERRFPYAYTYRDYVIAAFNEDLPYDRFILEQIAADQLTNRSGDASLAALGFLTVGRRFNNEHDDIDDRIDVTSRGLMGFTVSCARCHDHKYDAIPTEDYYSLYGVFASSHEPDVLPLVGDPEETPGYDEFKAELNKRRNALEDFANRKHAELLDVSRQRVTDYLVRAISNQPESLLQKLPFISLSHEELKPKLVERWRRFLIRQAKVDDPVFGLWYQLSKLPDADFSSKAGVTVTAAIDRLDVKYNPLVVAALSSAELAEKIDVARLYGKLFEDAYAAWKEAGADANAIEQLAPPQRELARLLLDTGTPADIPREDLRDYLTRADGNKYRELEQQIDSHQVDSLGAPARAMVLLDKPQPYEPRVFIRGNHARQGAHVPRRFPAVLVDDSAKPFQVGSGRLELAQAIVDPANPLTARVIVNRVWMHHFGEPLVATPSDFGTRSDPPTHPELLDYLARSLIENGWSLKRLHRSMMLSSTYRQQSADRPECRVLDQENRLLWRMNRRRLEFEPLRDSILSVAGEIDFQVGGRPVDLMEPPFVRRRAVYGLIDRQDLPSLLRSFDFASPDQSSARRPKTTVPQQALFMMNSAFVAQQARALAAHPDITSVVESSQRINALHLTLFGRQAKATEIQVGQRFVESASQHHDADQMSAWEQYAQLLLLTNEFIYVD